MVDQGWQGRENDGLTKGDKESKEKGDKVDQG